MSTQVEKFDPSKLMDGVRDRVKATFVSLIPDEQWEQMIKNECDKFFEPRKINTYHRDTNYFSDFQTCCFQVISEVAKEKIKIALSKYESDMWSNNELVTNNLLKELLIKNAFEIFAAMMGSRMQQIINEMKNRGY